MNSSIASPKRMDRAPGRILNFLPMNCGTSGICCFMSQVKPVDRFPDGVGFSTAYLGGCLGRYTWIPARKKKYKACMAIAPSIAPSVPV